MLFLNGEITSREIGKIRPEQFDLILAADGGAKKALAWQFSPRYVVGDLDSVTKEVRKKLPNAQFMHRPSQELNDLEKALQFCREKNVSQLTILGIGGGRLDHTLNNFSVLCRYDTFFDLQIYDAHSQIFLVRDKWKYEGEINQLISLIPLGKVEGVKTGGLAFPLNDEPLHFGVREGLSNYILCSPVSVSVRHGVLLVFAHEDINADLAV